MKFAHAFSVSAALLAFGSFTSAVRAHGDLGDMMVYVDNGKLVTSHYDFDGGTGLVTDPGPALIYLTELESDWEGGGTPGVDEPGIATDGSHPSDPDGQLFAFPANTALTASAQVLPLLNVNLAYWDGNGAASFGSSPHTFTIEDAFATITLDGGVATPVGTVSPWVSDANGQAHGHLEFLLDEADATATPGIYLFSLAFAGGGASPSDPVYYLAGFGLDEPHMDGALESAEAWVEQNMVPEPTVGLLGALGVLCMISRRGS
jgi:hypothetical protein